LNYEQYVKLIDEKRRGEEAYAQLLEGLKEKAEQAYYAHGAFKENFEFCNVWFDYNKHEIFLEYDIWIGEATNDQLRFDISEFWNADFSEAAAKAIEAINFKKTKQYQHKEQDERELLAKLKQKYEA